MQRFGQTATRVLAALLISLVAFAGSGRLLGAAEAAPAGAPTAPPPPPEPAQAGQETVVESGDAIDTARTGLYRGVVSNRRSGKPVEGAVLVFMNEETGDTFEVTTDENGTYQVRLPAGEYIVDIRVGRKVYRSTGTFREEASGKRWVMDFTIGSKLTDRDLKIQTSARDIRVIPTEPRPPLEPSRKLTEFLIFLGGVIGVAALAD